MATWPKSGHQQKRDSRDSKQLALPMQKNGPNWMKIVITVAKMALRLWQRCQAMPAPILKKNLIFLPVHFMLALIQIWLFRPIEPISCLVVVSGPRKTGTLRFLTLLPEFLSSSPMPTNKFRFVESL